MNKAAFIVIDSGFSRGSMLGASRVLGIRDLGEGRTVCGAPFVDAEELNRLAIDPVRHGSIVLERLRALDPDAPLVLIKAYGADLTLARTTWQGGRQVAEGWVEAYLWAVELCQKAGLPSVANGSFGGFTHGMDGTGWESFQLGRATGSGRSGHVLVAAAGPGDGRAVHASWLTEAGSATTLEVYQQESASYNLWAGAPGVHGWQLEVWQGGNLLRTFDGTAIAVNFWNNRQQLTFTLEGTGEFHFRLVRGGDTVSSAAPELRFDCWVVRGGGAFFLNHVDPTLVSEPAIFPQVLSAGLRNGCYSPAQCLPGGKPDILLEGGGPISFRLPEVTAAVGRLLTANPSLDVDGVRSLIGKYPGVPGLRA